MKKTEETQREMCICTGPAAPQHQVRCPVRIANPRPDLGDAVPDLDDRLMELGVMAARGQRAAAAAAREAEQWCTDFIKERAEKERAERRIEDAVRIGRENAAERSSARMEVERLTNELAAAESKVSSVSSALRMERLNVAHLAKERDACMRAKEENGDRLTGERDAALAELAAVKSRVEYVESTHAALAESLFQAEKDRDENQRGRDAVWAQRDAATAQCDLLRASVEASRSVVEAAVKWRRENSRASWSYASPVDRGLCEAVDGYSLPADLYTKTARSFDDDASSPPPAGGSPTAGKTAPKAWRVTSYEGRTPGGRHRHSVCFGREDGDCDECMCDVVAATEAASLAKAERLAAMLNDLSAVEAVVPAGPGTLAERIAQSQRVPAWMPWADLPGEKAPVDPLWAPLVSAAYAVFAKQDRVGHESCWQGGARLRVKPQEMTKERDEAINRADQAEARAPASSLDLAQRVLWLESAARVHVSVITDQNAELERAAVQRREAHRLASEAAVQHAKETDVLSAHVRRLTEQLDLTSAKACEEMATRLSLAAEVASAEQERERERKGQAYRVRNKGALTAVQVVATGAAQAAVKFVREYSAPMEPSGSEDTVCVTVLDPDGCETRWHVHRTEMGPR